MNGVVNLPQIADPGSPGAGRTAMFADTSGKIAARTASGISAFITLVSVPVSSTSAGEPGDFAVSATHVFFYTGDGSTHTWIKIAGAQSF